MHKSLKRRDTPSHFTEEVTEAQEGGVTCQDHTLSKEVPKKGHLGSALGVL